MLRFLQRLLIIIPLGAASAAARAQSPDAAEPASEPETAPEPPLERARPSFSSRDNRSQSPFGLSVIPLSFGWVLPTKQGLAASWHWNADWAFELEYLRARYGIGFLGVDIGQLSEQHRSLSALYFAGNSFYWKAGLTRRSYLASFGSDYLSRITGTNYLAGADVRIANETLHLALGNRWLLDSGVSLGIEWFELLLAVGKGTVTQSFMNKVEDVGEHHELHRLFDYLRYGTTFQSFKLSVGYTF